MAKIILTVILVFSMVIPFGGYYLSRKKERSFKASLAVTELSCIVAGVAVASAASAAIGALSEDSSIMGKALIFVALAESIALYGLLISFSILG